MEMVLTDWMLLGALALSMVLGLWRGFVFEVLSLAGWVAAFVGAQWLAADVIDWLPFVKGAPAAVQYAVAFVVVFVLILLAVGVLTWLIKKLIETVGLSPVDRVLGAGFGLVRGVVLLLALTVVVQLTGLSGGEWWQSARGPAWLDITLEGLKPLLPTAFVKYLP